MRVLVLNVIKIALITITLALPPSLYADSPTDDDIEDAIESEIALDDVISSNLDVIIESHRGKVTLEGTVDSVNEANRLIDIARSASGVSNVDSTHLTIRRPSSD